MKNIIIKIYYEIMNRVLNLVGLKTQSELNYWKARKAIENVLSNEHYEFFYTTHFGLDRTFFYGKKILDIGCGPRGSLEWAHNASERVGLDPLVESYHKLGIEHHKMKYVSAPAEHIPFPDGYFDVVTSFNSLDHVDNLEESINEIVRVVASGGLFLFLTEVNHPPTAREPISYSWDIVEKFKPDLKIAEEKHYERPVNGMYQSIRAGIPYDHSNKSNRYGILSAKFVKEQ
ncbi:MAG: class I SAM-dependent methyltransferase [Candidatus Omnitrophota bacterium]